MKSDLNNGYNERDKKNDDLEKNGDVDMPNDKEQALTALRNMMTLRTPVIEK